METPSPWLLSLVLGTLAAGANVLGGLLVTLKAEWNETLLRAFVAVGAGFMLAAALLRMLPESFALTPRAPALVLGGYLLVHFFEHTVAPHFHFGEEVHPDLMKNPVVGISAVAGLAAHTFFDGVSIASGFLLSAPLGILIFCAVALHKIPEGFTVASIVLASGRGRKEALLSSVVLAAATLTGVLFMHAASAAVAYALPLSTGVTFYVAASDLIPRVNEEHGVSWPVLVFLGVAFYALAASFLEATLGR